MEYLFVYGTLKRGGKLHRYMDGARFIGEGRIEGYRMYLVDWYPAVVRGYGNVYGEVYMVDRKLLRLIDGIEEEGVLYRREKVDVKMGDKTIKCWVYIYLGSVSGLEPVEDGTFPV
ncbi:MAG: gamma-glutamylcyclotransferase [Aquificae bacterium]|nr:gamma-glutamylcyclotransferase [Aquificota bacterium]